jgi:hypothetical protein
MAAPGTLWLFPGFLGTPRLLTPAQRHPELGLFFEAPPLPTMKIKAHRESHIIELEDGSQWRIFPGDLDVTLSWTPEANLTVLPIEDEIASHVLVSDSAPFALSRPVSTGLRTM